METNIRAGKISSIDYAKGMVKVTYPDKEGEVTADLPYLNFGGQYFMPEIDDLVLVLHMSNGTSMGIVCGPVWNEANAPYEVGKGLYRQEMSNTQNKAVIRYSDASEEMRIRAASIVFEAYGAGTISVATILGLLSRVSDLEKRMSSAEGRIKTVEGKV